jgi:hypothetical protein
MPDAMLDLKKKARTWGHWAFARYCCKRGIAFEICYEACFHRKPVII